MTALPNGKSTLDSDCKLIEVIPISDEDIFHRATEASAKLFHKDSAIACGRGQLKPLILFEDVDITFAEDRGFVTAIQQIAEKAKGPVILTSNSKMALLLKIVLLLDMLYALMVSSGIAHCPCDYQVTILFFLLIWTG